MAEGDTSRRWKSFKRLQPDKENWEYTFFVRAMWKEFAATKGITEPYDRVTHNYLDAIIMHPENKLSLDKIQDEFDTWLEQKVAE